MILNSIFNKFELVCKIRVLFDLRLGSESGRGRSPLVQNGTQCFAGQVAQLVLEYLDLGLAMQRKQQHNIY